MEAWSRPVENSPLASTRLAGTGNNTTVNSNAVSSEQIAWNPFICMDFLFAFKWYQIVVQNQPTVFCVRCGTPRGIITHWFRSETNRDMATWARSLVQGSHNAINYQREFSFRCLYQVKSNATNSIHTFLRCFFVSLCAFRARVAICKHISFGIQTKCTFK